MTNFYLIPGFGEKTDEPGYSDIKNIAEKKGYKVITHDPDWDKAADSWIEEFEKVLSADNSEKQILGFSMGAYIAALSAKNHTFSKIFFCSLSPYFKSDIEHLPRLAFEVFGEKRMETFSQYDFPKNISSEAFFIVGDKEIPIVIERSKKSYEVWSGKKNLILLQNVGHDISEKKYLEVLEEII